VLAAGDAPTGKTTLVNALVAEFARTSDRVILIEDTRERQCAAAASLRLSDIRRGAAQSFEHLS
jgi:Flp pilus assembly CpaF family ATPase